MPIIRRSCIDEIKARVSIHDVVSRTVSLSRAGSSFKGLSPFNQEKTPSFFVSPEKGLYKCFSSGKAGDIFTFVMETERLSFQEAVETIARRFGIELVYEEGNAEGAVAQRSLRQQLLTIHEAAVEYFHQELFGSSEDAALTRAYWTEQRGFPRDLAVEHKIGLAPRDGGRLLERCLKKGASLEAIKDSGLFYQRGNRLDADALMPRFRGRLMIPISDHQGRPVAFAARQLPITPKDDPSHEAKYINSPETPIFSKGHLLFGLDRARLEAGPERPFLLVEGQLDTLRCRHVGLTTAVAPQGTAITEHQLVMLRRYCPRVDCLLDGDEAGAKAGLRLLPLAFKTGIDLRFLLLPPGQDPDSLLREGGLGAWEKIRSRPVSPMAFVMDRLLPDPGAATPQRKAGACHALFEILQRCDSEVAQSEYLREAAAILRLDRDRLAGDFSGFLRKRQRRGGATSLGDESGNMGDSEPAPPPKLTTAEETILLLCLHYPNMAKPLAGAIDHDWISGDTLAGRLLRLALAEIEHDLWEGRETLEHLLDSQDERNLLHSLAFKEPSFEDPAKIANEAFQHLYKCSITAKIRAIDVELAQKSDILDPTVVFLQRKRTDFRRRLLNLPRLEGVVEMFL